MDDADDNELDDPKLDAEGSTEFAMGVDEVDLDERFDPFCSCFICFSAACKYDGDFGICINFCTCSCVKHNRPHFYTILILP